MGYRDEGEAAHARAEALERELEETAHRLAEAERELKEAKAALEEERREAEEERRETEEEDRNKSRAERKLNALRARAAEKEAKEEREKARAKKAAPGPPPLSEEEKRILRSTSTFAESSFGSWAIAFGIPGFYFSIWMSVSVFEKPYGLLLGFSLVLGLAWSAWTLARRWAAAQPEAERRWAKSRPYALLGYPEILGVEPRQMHFRWGDGHTTLEVELSFEGETPAELLTVLRGFDNQLNGRGERFERESPLTTYRSRSGMTYREDSNAAIRKWVRRFDEKVLVPLHEAHGLTSVRYRLGSKKR